MGQTSLFGKGVMEFAGTFLLVCTASFRPVPAAVCGTLACIIYMGVDISGAHYNPAVTLTFYLRGRCTLPDMVAYIPMQLLGGIAGACVGRTVSGVSEIRFVPGVGYSFGQAMYAEVLFTFALCYSILTIALRHDAVLNPAFGLAITGVIFAGIHCVGNISGAAFNPAVALALAFANGGDFTYALFVSVANFIGAIVATVVFYLTAPEEVNALPWQWVKRLEQAATQRRRHESEPLIASVSSSKR